MPNFGDFQAAIYAEGMFAGKTPKLTTNLASLEEWARDSLSPEAMGYIVPSAGSGATASANRAAFDNWRIMPRMLANSKERDVSCTVLGTEMAAPVMIAPVGVQTLAHPDGELATARAAAALGLTYTHSTQAGYSIEKVAEANGSGSRWYQLYYPNERELCQSFLERAKAAGYSVLVVTLDTTVLGWRPADLDRGFLPFLKCEGIANYLGDPAFNAPLEKSPEEDPFAAALRFAQVFPNPGLSWEDLAFVREHWDGPIVLKGICSPADARLAAEHGVDGVIVSNHGGRQVDGAMAALDCLPGVVDEVGEELTVLFDSGVRTGADVFKALALGAEAVLLGRPFLYGLALDGQAGVEHVLKCLLAELDLTLTGAGYGTHRDLNADSLVRV